MARSEGFRTMAEVEQELLRLDEIRNVHEARLERHWQAMLDHDVRGRLMKDAAHDMTRSWKPTRMLNSLFGEGSFGPSLATALARRGGGWKTRALMFALSMAAPALIKRAQHLSFSDIVEELKVSYDRVRDFVSKRNGATTHQDQ